MLAYDDLGAYKYLLRVAVDGGIRDATVDAVASSRTTTLSAAPQLLATLEEFLRRHGSISATSEALYVHPNTLRQRLRRIGELSGLDLRRDEWLAIEIAVKMVSSASSGSESQDPIGAPRVRSTDRTSLKASLSRLCRRCHPCR